MALASLPVKRDIFVGVFWPSLSFVKVWWGLDWIWDGVVERELVIVRSYLVFLLLGVGERHKVLGSKVHWFYHTLGLASLASPRLDPLQNILFGYLQHNLRNIQFLFARAPGILVGICLQICFGSTGARSFCTWDAREADCTFFCESYMLFMCMYLLVRLSWFLQRFHCADRWEELRGLRWWWWLATEQSVRGRKWFCVIMAFEVDFWKKKKMMFIEFMLWTLLASSKI